MLEFLASFWYLWLFVLLALLYRLFKPLIKGWFGEKTVLMYLRTLPKNDYVVLSDLILPTETGGTTQIDHVVVSVYGIFVIEVKNYTGWIFGSEQSAQWTQNIYGKKNSFMNPLRQNYAHVKAIKNALSSYPNIPVIPMVAFSANCDLKVNTTSHVVYFQHVSKVIRSYENRVLEDDTAQTVAHYLQDKNINNAEIKREHVEKIIIKKNEIETATAGDKCPKCSGILVERKGKYGRFIGCSNYPKCRFTKPIP